MSLLARLKELRSQRKDLLDGAGKILSDAKGKMTPEQEQEFDRRHAEGDQLRSRIERIEKQIDAERQLAETAPESRSANPQNNPSADPQINDEQRKKLEDGAFRSYIGGGFGAMTDEQRAFAQKQMSEMPQELRALSASTGGSGAYTIPQGFQRKLETALKWYGPMWDAAEIIDTGDGAVLPYPSINDTGNSGEQLAENTAAATNQDPSYGVVNLSAYTYDSAVVKIPFQLVQDSAFDVEAYLTPLLGIRIGRKTNNLFTVGTGSSQPNGIVTAATLGKTAASATAITYLELLDLKHSVDIAYRINAKFMANDSTLLLIKKLVDSNGRPLWVAGGVSEGVQGKRPDTLDGDPIIVNNDMATAATGNKSVLYGDLSKYKIRRVRGIQTFRFNERFMDALQIGLIAYVRADGNLIDAGTHPVKYLQQA